MAIQVVQEASGVNRQLSSDQVSEEAVTRLAFLVKFAANQLSASGGADSSFGYQSIRTGKHPICKESGNRYFRFDRQNGFLDDPP